MIDDSLTELRALVQDANADPSQVLLRANAVVSAMTAAAQQGSRVDGYEEAVRLFDQVAGRAADVPAVTMKAHEHRSSLALYRARVAGEEGDMAGALTFRAQGVAERRAALALVASDAGIRPQYLVQLATELAVGHHFTGVNECDEAVALCREALSLPAGQSPGLRPVIEHHLAFCLLQRAAQAVTADESDAAPDPVPDPSVDLDEADELLRRVIASDESMRTRAEQLRAELAKLRVAVRDGDG
jgi:hypothetical protein